MKKVLLLNPPAQGIYNKDCFCSHPSKANYLYHPLDLVIQSGFLKDAFEVEVLDAMALGLPEAECYRRALKARPEAIVFLTGFHTWQTDWPLVASIKGALGSVLIGCGDILWGNSLQAMERYPLLDGIILDFTAPGVRWYLTGQEENIQGMVYRSGDRVVEKTDANARGEFSYPVPCHERFPLEEYTIPVALHHPYVSLLSNYGCPFHCYFCPCGSQSFKNRRIDNVMEELGYIRSLGIREIRFRDNTFSADRGHAMEICSRMARDGFRFTWSCLSRVDVVDETVLATMKKAGCHTIFFGVECGNDLMRTRYKNGVTTKKVLETFSLCRALGIRTLAHFMVGFPGEGVASINETVRFALDLNPDFVSFTVLEARPGTRYRQEAVARGWISPEDWTQARCFSDPRLLSNHELDRLQRQALRRFYLRPRYILRRMLNIKSAYELQNLVSGGLSLTRTLLTAARSKGGRPPGAACRGRRPYPEP